MLLLPVAFCTPIHKHGCDLNIEGGEGANVILCYNICDRDCGCIPYLPTELSSKSLEAEQDSGDDEDIMKRYFKVHS